MDLLKQLNEASTKLKQLFKVEEWGPVQDMTDCYWRLNDDREIHYVDEINYADAKKKMNDGECQSIEAVGKCSEVDNLVWFYQWTHQNQMHYVFDKRKQMTDDDSDSSDNEKAE